MGPASLSALLKLPILALDTAANGGTNFSKLELFRSDEVARKAYEKLANVGHSAEEMVLTVNRLLAAGIGGQVRCRHLIISGGVSGFMDGYYLTELAGMAAIYGQASAFLRYAREDYSLLETYVQTQLRGLELAKAYLRLRR